MTPNKDPLFSFRPCIDTTKSAHGGIGRITGICDIRLRCRRRSGGVGYATLHDVILHEELEENLFSYQVVMGKGYKLQEEGEDVWLVNKEEKEVLWAKREGRKIGIQEMKETARFISYQERHNALGHPNVQVPNQAMNDGLYIDAVRANRGPRPSADPWMAWLCSGPTADPGHPRMIHLMQNSLPCIVTTRF